MMDRHYQLMARSAGAQVLRSQGGHLYSQSAYGNARSGDPYYSHGTHASSTSYAQNAAQFGSRSDYYLPSDSRAQLISERRSSLPGAFVDPIQACADHAEPRMIGARPSVAEMFPYSSSQRPGNAQPSAAAFASSDLLRTRRAEVAAAYDPSAGGRVGRLGNLDDTVLSKEGLLSAGAYLNGPRRLAGSSFEEQDVTMPRVAAGQHGVLGSVAGARPGREDLERYLLAVQPEKLVRYAAACLSPEPAIKRARYAMMTNNVAPPPEVDLYSNYRQAKLRRSAVGENNVRFDSRPDRSGSRPFGTTSGSGSGRREKEKEPSRERRRKPDDRVRVSEKKSDSPVQDNRKGSSGPKGDDCNRVDQPHNSSQSSGGGNRFSGEKKGNAGPKRPSVQTEHLQETGHKEDNHVDSDKDSELGSLGADLSDFEDEKIVETKKTKKKVSEEPEAVIDAPLDGMIFGCSSDTFHECMRLQLFGLPSKNKDEVMQVAPGTKLFLFNFDTKELSGIFEAVSHGGMMIQPDAFREFGSFPAQVQVCCVEQCPNIPLADFKPAIKENFVNGFKFKFTLNAPQVKDLIRLFRRAARFQHQQVPQRQQGGLLHRYAQEPIPSEDYPLRSAHHQRQTYPQHPQASFGLSSISSARVVPFSTKSKVPEGSSRKARRGRRKKRKVENERPKFPKADNCSSLKQPEDMGADIARNASKPREDDDTSNTNLSVVVRKVIVTDNSKNFYQQKHIVEDSDTIPDSKRSDPPEPHHEISTSVSGEYPGLQSDHEDSDGKQVSLVEDGSNDGKCGLAGGRSEGQGKGLNVLKEALEHENVITKSSDSTPPSSGVHEGLNVAKTPQPVVNLGSPNKDSAIVAGEVQPVGEVDFSQVVMSDGLDVEETEENLNSAAGCRVSFLDREALESPVKRSFDLLVDEPGEEGGETVCERPDDSTKAVETSLGVSRYTITNVSDPKSTDQKGEGEKATIEQLDGIFRCEDDHHGLLVSQGEEDRELTNQHERDYGHSCELTNLDVNSDKDGSDSWHSNNLISDTESMSPREAENEQMVGLVYEDTRFEIASVGDVEEVKEAGDSDLPNVEDVDQVMEVGDRDAPDVEDVKQVTEIDDDGVVRGENLQINVRALEVEKGFVNGKLRKAAENEEDMIDDESSSEIPQTSDSEGDDEYEYELGLADEATSETDETEAEDEEEGSDVGLEVNSIGELPQLDDKVVVQEIENDNSVPLSEACDDKDVVDTVNGGVTRGREILGQEAKRVCHEGENMDDTESRCRSAETKAESQEMEKMDAVSV